MLKASFGSVMSQTMTLIDDQRTELVKQELGKKLKVCHCGIGEHSVGTHAVFLFLHTLETRPEVAKSLLSRQFYLLVGLGPVSI